MQQPACFHDPAKNHGANNQPYSIHHAAHAARLEQAINSWIVGNNADIGVHRFHNGNVSSNMKFVADTAHLLNDLWLEN